jgi:hypothetical protein
MSSTLQRVSTKLTCCRLIWHARDAEVDQIYKALGNCQLHAGARVTSRAQEEEQLEAAMPTSFFWKFSNRTRTQSMNPTPDPRPHMKPDSTDQTLTAIVNEVDCVLEAKEAVKYQLQQHKAIKL